MVAVTPLSHVNLATATTPNVHTGGSYARSPASASVPASADGPDTSLATVLTLSDHAKLLMADAKAAQAMLDALAGRSGGNKPGVNSGQTVIAHDVQNNAGLYIAW